MNNSLHIDSLGARRVYAVLLILVLLTGFDGAYAQGRNLENKPGVPVSQSRVPGGAPYDFDGDNKTDFGVYRQESGQFWQLNSSDGGNSATQFGSGNGDYAIPADYTGDGISDKAFYRFGTSEFFVLRSEDNSFYSFHFGIPNSDFPIVGDFDGDGVADPGVFRMSPTPGQTAFYILKSTGGVRIENFGTINDLPIIADYDGDGTDDIAVYRWNNAEWWIKKSSGGVSAYTFGIPSGPAVSPRQNFGGTYSIPVSADYTGDGKADVAYYTNQGDWYIIRSEDNSYYSFPFGIDGDYPLIGDYDGDGISDPGVFRFSTNTWYLLQSSEGFKALVFGQEGDYPLSLYRLGLL